MTNQQLALELKGIVKQFPGVIANQDVNFSVRAGSIHALVGENGAGKSTLMKILYGMQRPDEGSISIDGELNVTLNSPSDAIALGIGMVHQHFMLADNFTALENIVLGNEPKSGLSLNLLQAKSQISELAKTYSLEVPLDDYVSDLGVGERQRIEILKVLYRGARILILDEPTAVLVPQEVTNLFTALRRLKSEGVTIVFISHKLDEVLEIADEITVMRSGKTIGTINVQEQSIGEADLAELMIGSELPSAQTQGNTVTSEAVLAVAALSAVDDTAKQVLTDISFTIHRGEILGVAGVDGNGQSELIDALFGIIESTGAIDFMGEDISSQSTRKRRESGIGFIPEDRTRQGLLLDAPLWENRMLGHQSMAPNANGFVLSISGAKADTERIVSEFDVRTPNIDVPARTLSGGNQQKLIVGREMSGNPKLLIAAHPTRGVDVGAQAAIWDQLRRARSEGLAVLLISADLDELIGLSDSVCVMLRGRIVDFFDPQTVTPIELGSAMTGIGVN
mgnify:CR=1 FL=1